MIRMRAVLNSARNCCQLNAIGGAWDGGGGAAIPRPGALPKIFGSRDDSVVQTKGETARLSSARLNGAELPAKAQL